MRALDGCAGYGVDDRVRISNLKFEISNKFNCNPQVSLLRNSFFVFLMDCSSLLDSLTVCGVIPHRRRTYESL
jgi:hypothetical protein